MLDLATVRCEEFTACLNQDFDIVRRGTTADYADVSDEEIIIPGSSPLFSIRAIRVIRG